MKTFVLPDDFKPSINEVIIGRGRRVAEHVGNKRLHEVVKRFVTEYAAAPTKRQKSSILSKVVAIIRNGSCAGGFVKKDSETGQWRAVEDAAARIAVAQAFRDALSKTYRSSKQFKQQKRQDRKELRPREKQQPASALRAVKPTLCCSSTTKADMTLYSGTATVSVSDVSRAAAPTRAEDTFTLLLATVEASVDLSTDPFEPTPISEKGAFGRATSKAPIVNTGKAKSVCFPSLSSSGEVNSMPFVKGSLAGGDAPAGKIQPSFFGAHQGVISMWSNNGFH